MKQETLSVSIKETQKTPHSQPFLAFSVGPISRISFKDWIFYLIPVVF